MSIFILGLLSVIQIAFLPGILILRFCDLKKGFIHTMVFAFGLSLIANHLLVFAITAIGINITISYSLIFVLELVAIFWLYANPLRTSIEKFISSKRTEIQEHIGSLNFVTKEEKKSDLSNIIVEIINLIFFILALSSIWWAFRVWYTNLDTVFTQWDSIVSWNRWATEWFSGIFPIKTNRYAQLVPTNFAVSYAFLGNTKIQFFAKSIMPLFNLYILLLMFDLGLSTKNPGYFIGVVASRYIIKKFLGDYIASGYVDVALAFFSFLTVYSLLKARSVNSQTQKRNYVKLGFIFAAGTALTKQNGLYVFAFYPLLSYVLAIKDFNGASLANKIAPYIKWFAISLCIILPWYLLNEFRIQAGTIDTNVGYLMGARHQGRDLFERFVRAVGLLEEYAILYIFILFLLPFLDSALIWVTITLLIPYSVIWVFAFSTFPRNLAISLPLLGMMTGLSAQRLIDFIKHITQKIELGKLKFFVVIVGLAGLVMAGSFYFQDERLINHQEEQQKGALLSYINQQIYDYFEEIGQFQPIMTNYPIRYLPGMEDLQIDIDNFSNYNTYLQVIQNHPEVRLLLLFENTADDLVMQDIHQKIEQGDFELIFKDGKYSLIKINNR